MKMELIGALLHWPSVIFLDEPTIGLDVLAAHKLREFLREFNSREKATIILTSHNMEDIERLCSRVMILRSGDLIYDGAPEGLTQADQVRLRLRFKVAITSEQLGRLTGMPVTAIHANASNGDEGNDEDREDRPFHISLKKEQIVPTLQKIMAHYEIADMGIEEASLESVIQRLYESSAGEGSA